MELEVKKLTFLFYKTEKRYDNNLEAKYVLFNWAFPKNLNSSMALADKILDLKNSMKKYLLGGSKDSNQVMNHLMNKAIVGTVLIEP